MSRNIVVSVLSAQLSTALWHREAHAVSVAIQYGSTKRITRAIPEDKDRQKHFQAVWDERFVFEVTPEEDTIAFSVCNAFSQACVGEARVAVSQLDMDKELRIRMHAPGDTSRSSLVIKLHSLPKAAAEPAEGRPLHAAKSFVLAMAFMRANSLHHPKDQPKGRCPSAVLHLYANLLYNPAAWVCEVLCLWFVWFFYDIHSYEAALSSELSYVVTCGRVTTFNVTHFETRTEETYARTAKRWYTPRIEYVYLVDNTVYHGRRFLPPFPELYSDAIDADHEFVYLSKPRALRLQSQLIPYQNEHYPIDRPLRMEDCALLWADQADHAPKADAAAIVVKYRRTDPSDAFCYHYLVLKPYRQMVWQMLLALGVFSVWLMPTPVPPSNSLAKGFKGWFILRSGEPFVDAQWLLLWSSLYTAALVSLLWGYSSVKQPKYNPPHVDGSRVVGLVAAAVCCVGSGFLIRPVKTWIHGGLRYAWAKLGVVVMLGPCVVLVVAYVFVASSFSRRHAELTWPDCWLFSLVGSAGIVCLGVSLHHLLKPKSLKPAELWVAHADRPPHWTPAKLEAGTTLNVHVVQQALVPLHIRSVELALVCFRIVVCPPADDGTQKGTRERRVRDVMYQAVLTDPRYNDRAWAPGEAIDARFDVVVPHRPLANDGHGPDAAWELQYLVRLRAHPDYAAAYRLPVVCK